jgi:lipid-A-disaccharide synthase-like uncharacterized protein
VGGARSARRAGIVTGRDRGAKDRGISDLSRSAGAISGGPRTEPETQELHEVPPCWFRPEFLLVAAVAMGTALGVAPAAFGSTGEPRPHIEVRLDGMEDTVAIHQAADGSLRFELRPEDGEPLLLTPQELAERVYLAEGRRRWWQRLLNISSPAGVAWVVLGFLGQALFTGRMLVQWLTSERHHRSVVPAAFWWLSLVGATMLLVYFVWRRDIVGVVGQAFGWAIYLRNLWLIHRPGPLAAPAQMPSGPG